MVDVGKMIATIRKERKMSQQELADRLKMSKQTISNYERGTRSPDYVTLEAIADILNVPVSMLISREKQEEALKGIYETYEVDAGKSRNVQDNNQTVSSQHNINATVPYTTEDGEILQIPQMVIVGRGLKGTSEEFRNKFMFAAMKMIAEYKEQHKEDNT